MHVRRVPASFGPSHDSPSRRLAALGVAASDHALLYVVCSPTGPYFRTSRMLSLMAVSEHVRSWPGGTGGYKLSGNYAPTFMPQKEAAKRGYDQVLWLIGETITEAGAMNFFVVLKREDGGRLLLIGFPATRRAN